MKKRGEFDHLFNDPKQKERNKERAKKALFGAVLLFFLLYLKYKPYETADHRGVVGVEYLFYLYQFVINQTLGIVHESGHGVCYLLRCPQFITALNGTIFQWLFPLGVAYYYKRQRNTIGYFLGLFVASISFDYTAWYISTTPEGAIVPASKSFLGVDGYHDFYYIFDRCGILTYSALASSIVRTLSVVVMIRAIFGLFFEAFATPTKSVRSNKRS